MLASLSHAMQTQFARKQKLHSFASVKKVSLETEKTAQIFLNVWNLARAMFMQVVMKNMDHSNVVVNLDLKEMENIVTIKAPKNWNVLILHAVSKMIL